jgi:DNA-binding response OmpR family regulator
VTASIFGDTSQDAIWAGADDTLLKPFRESELFEKIRKCLGAQYLYEEEAPAAPAGTDSPAVLGPGALAGLPPELISQLREAAINGDFQLLAGLIGRVEARDIPLAGVLGALANKYDMKPILTLLEKD